MGFCIMVLKSYFKFEWKREIDGLNIRLQSNNDVVLLQDRGCN